MKKIIISFVFTFILLLSNNVNALDCTKPGVEGCSCSTFGIDNCSKMYNSAGEPCDVVNGVCTVAPSGSRRIIEGDDPTTDDSYDNYESSGDVVCGKGWTFNRSIANVTYYMVLLFQVIAPIMLIIFGMIDLFKGITSGKDDTIKKGQATFIKRLVVALLLFFVITIVRMTVSFLSNENIVECFDCFVNGAKSCKQV